MANNEHRSKVASEMKKTEETYLTAMKLIPTFFIEPLKTSNIVPVKDLDKIFTGIEAIIKFGDMLTEQLNHPSFSEILGQIFLMLAPFLSIYTQYVNNWDVSRSTLEKYQGKPAFINFIKDCEAKASESFGRKTDMNDILIQPVQRVPRYLLLLQDLFKHTPQNHPDYSYLKQAIEKIQKVAGEINEKKRATEESTKILEIQQSIDGSFLTLLEAHRQFIREGDLFTLWGHIPQELHFFLFNDILLYVSPLQESKIEKARKRLSVATNLNSVDPPKWRYISFFEFQNSTIEDVPESATQKHVFALNHLGKRFLLAAKTEPEKAAWLKTIKMQIDAQKGTNMVKREYDSLMHVKMSGYLFKRGQSTIKWNRRYFRLKGTTLYYYHNPQESQPRGHIVLVTGANFNYSLFGLNEKPYGLLLKAVDEACNVYLYAPDLATCQIWIQSLSEIIPVEKSLLEKYNQNLSDSERQSKLQEFVEELNPEEDGLFQEDWFFGNIDRNEAENILKKCKQDSFIVRSSSMKDHYAISLVCAADKRMLHLLIRRIQDQAQNSFYELQDATGKYPTVKDLVLKCPQLKRYRALKQSDLNNPAPATSTNKVYGSVNQVYQRNQAEMKKLEAEIENMFATMSLGQK